MKAIRIEQTGGPEAMRLIDVDTPEPGPREVRIRAEAIGVNYIDTYHRGGLYPVSLPSGIGQEAAGVIDAIGAEVTRFKLGDRVAYSGGKIGAYAEAHTLDQDRVVELPISIDASVAASVMLKGMTARYLLRKTFPVQRGHVVVIHAAAGGVGQILVQWAKHLGATVIASVGSEAKAELVKKLGANHVLITTRDDIAKRVREVTSGVGADVVFDGVGKDAWDYSIDSLRPRGMMVNFGNASGAVPPISLLTLSVKGSLFVTRPTLNAYTATREELEETATDLFSVLQSGAVKITPATRYKLADAVQAHRDLEARKTTGSLVLIP